MTTKRKPRRRGKPAPPTQPAAGLNVEPAAPEQPFVNRVVLDNTVPEGFRYERVPSKPGVTG